MTLIALTGPLNYKPTNQVMLKVICWKGFVQEKYLIIYLEKYSKHVFSSPEPKAQGELLWSLTVRRRRRPYVRPSVRPQSLNNISS